MKKINLTLGTVAMSTIVLSSVAFASAQSLTRQLQLGMTGSDVGILQSFLARDASVYPQGIVSNYFGSLTKSAVTRFQTKNGIYAIGRVGPQTLGVINAQLGNTTPVNTGSAEAAPYISSMNTNINNNIVTISWNTNENAKGVVFYSTSPLSVFETENGVNVSGALSETNTTFSTNKSITLQNLQNNTTYYYMIQSTDEQGNVSVSVPSSFRIN